MWEAVGPAASVAVSLHRHAAWKPLPVGNSRHGGSAPPAYGQQGRLCDLRHERQQSLRVCTVTDYQGQSVTRLMTTQSACAQHCRPGCQQC
jgi:hypothetical protein